MIAFAVGFAVGVALTFAGYFLGRKHGETRAYVEMLSTVTKETTDVVFPPLELWAPPEHAQHEHWHDNCPACGPYKGQG